MGTAGILNPYITLQTQTKHLVSGMESPPFLPDVGGAEDL
jgi:hypothetical protein